ncbi:hypothetical protein F5Y18DRAFT_428407 [Xylariaceae sp. FL1019]|nr:hypothetical protein F5Y18DRAFT_428407 [Xylariaceae sp. FL1019]
MLSVSHHSAERKARLRAILPSFASMHCMTHMIALITFVVQIGHLLHVEHVKKMDLRLRLPDAL